MMYRFSSKVVLPCRINLCMTYACVNFSVATAKKGLMSTYISKNFVQL